jgi:hypothetical protein
MSIKTSFRKVTYPDDQQIARVFLTDSRTFHREIKARIRVEFEDERRKWDDTNNFDVGFDRNRTIYLRSMDLKFELCTNLKVDDYI